MKNGKKLTYKQKQILTDCGLNPNEWYYVKRIDSDHIQIVSKSGKTQIVEQRG